MSEQYSFYCTKPSDIPCHTQCDLCRKVRYKSVDIPTDQEDRIKMETDQYINLHYTNASVRTAVYWGCIAAARREYLLARRTAIAATQHPKTTAPQEVPADVMEWIRKEWLKDSNRHDFRNYEEAAIAMYRKIMEEMSATENPLASYWFEKARQCLVERNDFKGQLNRTNEQLANLEKNISTLTDDALKISEERDAFREGLERIFERRQGFQSGVIASELLKKYPKQ